MAACTFFVMIKLDPMATVPDTARARPTYLSSTMKSDAGGAVREKGRGKTRKYEITVTGSAAQSRTPTITFSTTRTVI